MTYISATMAMKLSLSPFLRPLQAPRNLSYRQCIRLSSSTPRHNEGTLVYTNLPPRPLQHTDIIPASTSASSTTESSSSPPLRTEPYHVSRTPSQQLPIYLLAKRGGNLHQTRVKKIEGDIATLRKELQQALVIDEEDIKINQLTRHIIIKVRAAHVMRVAVFGLFHVRLERLGCLGGQGGRSLTSI